MTTTALILAATDLVAAVLLSAIYFQRHRRRDLVVAFLGVNVGVLAVATVLGTAEVALGLGLGLFGVLSIIRLRSSEITQREVAYYFAALAIGLICGLPPVDLSIPLLLVGLIVAVLAVADHPRVLSRARHQTVHLDRAIADETELRAELERLLGGEVTGVTVQQLDLVDDTTLVDVRYRVSAARPVTAAPGGVRDIADAAPGPRRSADPSFADLIGGTR
jgi:Ca2+/Na+ antiporter